MTKRLTIEKWQEEENPKPEKLTKGQYERWHKKERKVAAIGTIMMGGGLIGAIALTASNIYWNIPSFGISEAIFYSGLVIAFIGFIILCCSDNVSAD